METKGGWLPGDVLDRECPSRLVLGRLGDKWTMLIVIALSSGVHRFSELRDRIGEVTPKVLTQSLRALERDGIVERTVYAVVPPKVEYQLTDLGQSLLEPIAAVKAWAESNYGAVLDARARELP
jgi:DNA-binding HxlR family transcriptional regulator